MSKDTHKPDPFISQNVWIKRLGLLILLVGMGALSMGPVTSTIFVVIVFLAIIVYIIKSIKNFIISLWKS